MAIKNEVHAADPYTAFEVPSVGEEVCKLKYLIALGVEKIVKRFFLSIKGTREMVVYEQLIVNLERKNKSEGIKTRKLSQWISIIRKGRGDEERKGKRKKVSLDEWL